MLYPAHRPPIWVIPRHGPVDLPLNGARSRPTFDRAISEQIDWTNSRNNLNGEPVCRLSRVQAECLGKMCNKNVLKKTALFKV